jgi:hypothetical protein
MSRRRIFLAALGLLVILVGVLLTCFCQGDAVTVNGKATPEDVRAIREAIVRAHRHRARSYLKSRQFGAALESLVQIAAPRTRQITVFEGQATTNGVVSRGATVLSGRSLYGGLIYRYSLEHTSGRWGQLRFAADRVQPTD